MPEQEPGAGTRERGLRAFFDVVLGLVTVAGWIVIPGLLTRVLLTFAMGSGALLIARGHPRLDTARNGVNRWISTGRFFGHIVWPVLGLSLVGTVISIVLYPDSMPKFLAPPSGGASQIALAPTLSSIEVRDLAVKHPKFGDLVRVAGEDTLELRVTVQNDRAVASLPATANIVDNEQQAGIRLEFALSTPSDPNAVVNDDDAATLQVGHCFGADELQVSKLVSAPSDPNIYLASGWTQARDLYGVPVNTVGAFKIPSLGPHSVVNVTITLPSWLDERSAGWEEGGTVLQVRRVGDTPWSQDLRLHASDSVEVAGEVFSSRCLPSYHAVHPTVRLLFAEDRKHAATSVQFQIRDETAPTYRTLGSSTLRWADNSHAPHIAEEPGTTATYSFEGGAHCTTPTPPRREADGIATAGLALGEMYGYKPGDDCDFDLSLIVKVTLRVQ